MSLKPLIDNQSIRVDDHARGAGEQKDFYDIRKDVHIHKITNFGKHNIDIRIPINSDRVLQVSIDNEKKNSDIPAKLRKEIHEALSNESKLNVFMDDILTTIQKFGVPLEDEETAKKVLERLSKHFDLRLTIGKKSIYNKDGDLISYAQKFTDVENKKYYSYISSHKWEIGRINGRKRIWGKYLK